MENIEDSYHYQAWLYDQLEPHERLFVGRKPKRVTPTWMLNGEPREEITEQELFERNKKFLADNGIDL